MEMIGSSEALLGSPCSAFATFCHKTKLKGRQPFLSPLSHILNDDGSLDPVRRGGYKPSGHGNFWFDSGMFRMATGSQRA